MSVQRLDRASSVLGMSVVVVEAVQLALWLVAPQALAPLLLDSPPTRPVTLVSFLLLGAVLGFRLPRAVRAVALSLVVLLALEGLVSSLLDRPLLSADVLYLDAWHQADTTGQMALSTALVLLALALALVLSGRQPGAASVLGTLAYGLGFVSLVGHLYGADSLTNLQTATAMAVPTVPVALATAVAVLLHRPELPVIRALRAQGTAGLLLRRHLGWALAVPPLAGWLVVRGERPAGSTRPTDRACSRFCSPPARWSPSCWAPGRPRGVSTPARRSRTGNGCSTCWTARRSASSRPTPTDAVATSTSDGAS